MSDNTRMIEVEYNELTVEVEVEYVPAEKGDRWTPGSGEEFNPCGYANLRIYDEDGELVETIHDHTAIAAHLTLETMKAIDNMAVAQAKDMMA